MKCGRIAEGLHHMNRRLVAIVPLAAFVVAVWAWAEGVSATASAADLPARLADQEFWRLVETTSEPNGYFRSDNLVSNEDTFQHVLPRLTATVKPGGVYLGVGPDQNFTFITALRPRIAFIVDIRRGNLLMHLMYKALIEMSPDRAEFLSRLFSRPRPAGLGRDTTAVDLYDAFGRVAPDRALSDRTFKAIEERLTKTHGFTLTPDDLSGIAYIFGSFYGAGPTLTYSSSGFGGRSRYPTFADLQTATDLDGVARSYTASEAHYEFLRTLQQRNLIVPVVGNFAGARALRGVGAWVAERGGTVTAFYTSNVEQYLFQDRLWERFAQNVMTLPLDETSTFIRSCFNNCSSSLGSRSVLLLNSMPALLRDFSEGRITSYWDVLSQSR